MTKDNTDPKVLRIREQQRRQWVAGDRCWNYSLTALTVVVSVTGSIITLADGEEIHRHNMRDDRYDPEEKLND